MRKTNTIDALIDKIDNTLRTLFPPTQRIGTRHSPAKDLPEASLSPQEKKHISGLMRVNHAGEVCAQALYQGQALTAQLTHIKKQMSDAAAEEIDHLAWCEERLTELGSKTSLLNPLWYGGSFILGALAGLAGDRVSLGFVMETERQVSAHLLRHLQKLPAKDKKSHSLLTKMKEDEEQHATLAMESGAIELPYVIKLLMHIVSKLMTKSSYYI
ncbi:2-polyprenyl-3-methyl-6-methoxy-1,4-benzoquinone monooxygenase [Legionella cincinnatiensis]|uniref:3-demethoxyubiquinol 3-hydroxylase n=1 Tax=Legionella cincinnatiensis TaxID=28085 RepID=A0A378IG53_9GAMM|nr:2-polyprenyl-3-methyl-6-methoxy-1,4-benzoquinone monooxygenase [Legionella cincinnatiensis]KTC92216.1 ubiquinone biosynthesis protein [Legionella cincinnatiensis]STX33481.1 ubiquinone biosynthesis protein [Legionella cincinnatiensis]